MYDEYAARSFYARVVEAFGARAPFDRIVRAEAQHIAALGRACDRLGCARPLDPFPAETTVAPTWRANCERAVAGEIANVNLYDTLLPYAGDAALRGTFVNLQAASRDKHLPAFLQALAEDEETFNLGNALGEAFASIPANLADAMGSWADPLGIEVGDAGDLGNVSDVTGVDLHTGTFGAMAARFDGAAGAFAYLLFILLYFPCTAAIAALYQEAGTRWTVFVAAWTTGLGYAVATIFYQAARWQQHPGASAAWAGAMAALFFGALLLLRRWGEREPGGPVVALGA